MVHQTRRKRPFVRSGPGRHPDRARKCSKLRERFRPTDRGERLLVGGQHRILVNGCQAAPNPSTDLVEGIFKNKS